MNWDNYDHVLEEVKKTPHALYYASYILKDNYDIVLSSVSTNPDSIMFASERLRDNDTIALTVLRQNGWLLPYFSNRIQNSYVLIWIAYQNGLPFSSLKKILREQYQTDTE